MQWLSKIFEDEKFLEYLTKVAIVFGPGFLLIGYYDPTVFMQLDWFKLLSLSGLFSVVLVGPNLVLIWLLTNFLPGYYQWKLRKYQNHVANKRKNLDEIKVELERFSEKDLDKEDSSRISRIQAKVRQQNKEIVSIEEAIDLMNQRLVKRRAGWLTVLTDSWVLFFVVFMLVLPRIAVSYLFGIKTSLRSTVSFLCLSYYIVIPLMLFGGWIAFYISHFPKHQLLRVSLSVLGIAIMSVAFGILIICASKA